VLEADLAIQVIGRGVECGEGRALGAQLGERKRHHARGDARRALLGRDAHRGEACERHAPSAPELAHAVEGEAAGEAPVHPHAPHVFRAHAAHELFPLGRLSAEGAHQNGEERLQLRVAFDPGVVNLAHRVHRSA
jgi:hypothetical protein